MEAIDNSVGDFYKNYLPKGFSLSKTQIKTEKETYTHLQFFHHFL